MHILLYLALKMAKKAQKRHKQGKKVIVTSLFLPCFQTNLIPPSKQEVNRRGNGVVVRGRTTYSREFKFHDGNITYFMWSLGEVAIENKEKLSIIIHESVVVIPRRGDHFAHFHRLCYRRVWPP